MDKDEARARAANDAKIAELNAGVERRLQQAGRREAAEKAKAEAQALAKRAIARQAKQNR